MAELSGTLAIPAAITARMRPERDGSDADLMRRTAGGDREAFAAVYRRHSGTVYRFARLMTGCDAAAEDVVQETFLGLLREAGRYDPQRASLSTYLYGIARHVTRRRLTRARRFVALDAEAETAVDQVPSAHQQLERNDEVGRLRRAILALPSRYREVLVLCDLQDMDYAAAASALGCAVGTVKSRLHRARTMLGERMVRAVAAKPDAVMRCAV